MRFIKLLLIIVAVIIIFKPIMLSAQMSSPEDICKQAKMDVKKDVNGTLWFVEGVYAGLPTAGFLVLMSTSPSPWYIVGGLVGLFGWPILPSIIAPYPPPSRYIGMPPDYVALYTKCYKKEEKKMQLSNALIGCVISTGVWVIIFH